MRVPSSLAAYRELEEQQRLYKRGFALGQIYANGMLDLDELTDAIFGDAPQPGRAVLLDLPKLPARSADDSEPDGEGLSTSLEQRVTLSPFSQSLAQSIASESEMSRFRRATD